MKFHQNQHVFCKILGVMFKMDYEQARWRQYCPIGGHFNLFCEVTPKKAKTGNFSHFGKLVKYCYCNIYSERELLLFDPIPPSLIQYGASNLIFGRFKPLCVTHIPKAEAMFFHLVLSWIRSYYVKMLSNSHLRFFYFPCYFGFQLRAPA